MRVPVFMFERRPPPDGVVLRAPAEISEIVRVDEAFRVARMGKDAAQVAHLVSEDFYGTDADGKSLDRQRLLDRIAGSTVRVVETRTSELRLAAGSVIVNGEQEITTADGRARTTFTRVYSRDPQDREWHLIASAEMHPRP